MDRKSGIIKGLKEFKKRLSQKIPVEKILFFGSMVSGEPHRYSDIDLIIVSHRFHGVPSYKRPLGFYKYWELDYPVDFLCYTPEEFESLSKRATIVSEALKEGIII
jgi:predicted nucleotidyltransferase